ncbi:MAG TPA: PH domain-containing protein [Longimicrobiales bacterium]
MPIDRGVLDQQLQTLREAPGWWEQRELRDLPAVMHADENILAISRGKIARLRWLRPSWLIVVTDRRVLLIRSASGNGWRQLEVAADQITRVTLRVGPLRGRVRIVAGGQAWRLLVPRADAYKLMNALSSLGTPSNEAFFGFGPTRMVRRVMDHVLALPAAALSPDVREPPPRPDHSAVERRLQSLEEEVEQLRQQVEFLEDLLRQRQPSAGTKETWESG